MIYNTEFNKNLVLLLVERGMSIKDLSEKMGVSRQYVYAIRHGQTKRGLSFNFLSSIKKALNLNDKDFKTLCYSAMISGKSVKISSEAFKSLNTETRLNILEALKKEFDEKEIEKEGDNEC